MVEMMKEQNTNNLEQLTVELVSAYTSNNIVGTDDLPALIRTVHDVLKELSGSDVLWNNRGLSPATEISNSVQSDHLICLEDGKKLKMLKRHLKTHYNMTPEEYRQKWGLSPDYPMVSPSYAKKRSSLAKEFGLGTLKSRQIGSQKVSK